MFEKLFSEIQQISHPCKNWSSYFKAIGGHFSVTHAPVSQLQIQSSAQAHTHPHLISISIYIPIPICVDTAALN